MNKDIQFTRRLSLNKREYDEVLDRLTASEGVTPTESDDSRSRTRYEYRAADLALRIEHPEGGVSHFLVFGRNISRSGISVLHGGFIHPGSACRMVLGGTTGQPIQVAGEVRHCRLIAGSCHEIGIHFDEEIDPSSLVAAAKNDDTEGASTDGGFLAISGTVLLAESFEPDRILLEHQLSLLGVEMRAVATPGATLDEVKRENLDLILFGLSLAADDGLQTIRRIREMGFTAPLLVVTADSNAGLIDRARQAGASDVISKPYNVDLLVAQLQAHLAKGAAPSDLYSTASDQPGMLPLVASYVEMVRRVADQVERTYQEELWPDLHEHLCHLRGSGCAYGYQNLTVNAIAVMNLVSAQVKTEDAGAAVTRLLQCCRSLKFLEPVSSAA